jgi:hypothetical protein
MLSRVGYLIHLNLQIVSIGNVKTLTNLHALQSTVAYSKYSHFVSTYWVSLPKPL